VKIIASCSGRKSAVKGQLMKTLIRSLSSPRFVVAHFLLGVLCGATFFVAGEEDVVAAFLSRMTLRTIAVICRFVRLQPRIRKFGTRKLWVVMCKS
jgi:hypothetical protein